MHVAAFIGKLQHYKNFKPSYLSIGKWAIRPFLSDQVTFLFETLKKHWYLNDYKINKHIKIFKQWTMQLQ